MIVHSLDVLSLSLQVWGIHLGHLSKTNEVKVSIELRHDSSFLRCSLSLSTGVGNTPGPPE